MCARRPPERILSAVRQQRFMATPGGLRPADVTAVVNSISAVVRTVLQPVPLDRQLTADDALQLLSKMHSGAAMQLKTQTSCDESPFVDDALSLSPSELSFGLRAQKSQP